MTQKKELYEELLKNYPPFLSTKQLVELGLYDNVNSITRERGRNIGPPYFQREHEGKIFYPKTLLIEYLHKKTTYHRVLDEVLYIIKKAVTDPFYIESLIEKEIK